MLIDFSVNYLSVFLSAVAAMVLGSLWYSPILFGNPWMKSLGLTKQSTNSAKNKGMAFAYILMFATAFLTAFILATLLKSLAVTSLSSAYYLTIILWAGFQLPLALGPILWERKSWNLFLINASYQIVFLIISATIIYLL